MALGFLATKARSDVLTLSPPADLVPGLVDALDHLCSAAAPGSRADLDELARRLAAGGALTARRDQLAELLAAAIDEAGERVALESTRLLRGERSPAELRARLEQLTRLLELFESL